MKKFYVLISVLILFLAIPATAEAQDGVVPYSVQAVTPENQVDNDVTYFDIEMEQGQSQNLEVVVYNSSDEGITVNIENNIATTNSNGLIAYDDNEAEPYESMEYPFSEISTVKTPSVDIAPNSQETVAINVEAPDESFDGVVLGGLYFTMDAEESEEEQSLQIQNRYSYALAVQISEAGNDNSVTPEIELMKVAPGIINHRTGLQTQFVNNSPMIISGLTFEGSVYEEGSEDPLYTRTVEDFTIAPDSKFNYPVMYDNQRLDAGDYVFRATASGGDNEWLFEEAFEITEETADEANDEAVELEEDNSWVIYLIVGLSVMVFILLIAVIYLVIRRR